MEAEIKTSAKMIINTYFRKRLEPQALRTSGLIMLKTPQALSFMKKINSRAHWEICKNKFASINYCQKGETNLACYIRI